MTAAPRRRRHDPLAPTGSGRVEPPGPSTIDLHTHTTRSDGVVAPAELVRQAADAGVRLLALTDHDTLAGLPRGHRRRRRPARPDPDPRRRDQRHRHPRPRAVGGRAPHPRLRDGPGRRGVRGDPRRPATPSPRAVREDRRAAARARPADRRPARPPVGLRRRRARPPDRRPGADRGRPRDERRGRLRAAARLGDAGLRAAQRARAGRGDRGDPRRRRAPGRWPISARRPTRIEVVRELVDAGLGGLEVYYRSFDVGHGRRGRRGRDDRSISCRPAGATTTATPGTYAEAHAGLWVPPEVAAGIPGAGLGRRLAGTAMTDRSTLDAAPCRCSRSCRRTAPSAPRRRRRPADDRLAEYLPEPRTLPRFHVWTLGCQMNRSDSEEMAGRLLAAGCEEADSLETRRPRRHQHLRDPRGRRAEGHRPDGPARPGSRRPTRRCGSC